MLLTTSGWPSCPCDIPVDELVTMCKFCTWWVLILSQRTEAKIAKIARRHGPLPFGHGSHELIYWTANWVLPFLDGDIMTTAC